MHDLQQRIPEDVQINRTHENTQVTKHLNLWVHNLIQLFLQST